ncbi:MAG: glycosyltransferase, partial [Bacteroidota bacterium]|nr:glycosyltransferase [Bacteroidota bacterium]
TIEEKIMDIILDYISYFLFFLLIVYVRQIYSFYIGLGKLTKGTNNLEHTITIIIPAKNEENNIRQCLQSLVQQNYPKEKFSIIVVDDRSTDNTATIVRDILQQTEINVTLFRTEDFSTIRSPKIRALTEGIQHSSGEIIVTTDADCIAHPNWISTINSYFETNVGIVTGLTIYQKNEKLSSLFWGIQFLDFISYTAIAAGVIGKNKVLVCNGSNMAFRIEAFDETGGFETLTHINTGDDSLLAQKIVETGKWKPRFAFEESATITTQPALAWKEVLNQRMRWVGQTAYYPAYMMFFMICTFIMFVGLTIAIPLTFIEWNSIPWIVVAGKFSIDYVIMNRFTNITRTSDTMKYFLPTALIHIPFVLIATIGGYFFSFEWKDQTLKKESV